MPSPVRSHACDATVPSMSLDDEVNVTVEPVGSGFGAALKAAVGARFAIAICFVKVEESPLSSVAFRPTVYVPAFENERDAVAAVPSSNWPSLSRSHACDAIVPSGSVAVEVKVIESPVLGVAGALVHPTAGGRFATVTVRDTVAALPLSSVTLRPTLKVPDFENRRHAAAAVPSSYSPSL